MNLVTFLSYCCQLGRMSLSQATVNPWCLLSLTEIKINTANKPPELLLLLILVVTLERELFDCLITISCTRQFTHLSR